MMRRSLSVPTEKVQTVTPDGVTLSATFVPASKLRAPLVLLLHQLGRDHTTYEPLYEPLRAAGFAILALDFRGHGGSTVAGTTTLNWEEFSEAEWRGTLSDAAAVLALAPKLRGVNAEKIAVVGASIGANVALLLAGSTQVISSIVLLSPGLNYRGLETKDAAARLAGKPTLIVAAQNDTYSRDSSQELVKLIPESRLEVLAGDGHGTDLLGKDPKLEALLIAHLAPLAQGR